MARIYQTRSWHEQMSPSMEELELLALEAYAHLPEQFRSLTGEIVIQIAEFPTDEFDTIGGFVTQRFGHMPKRGESLRIEKFNFNVQRADSRKVQMLQVTLSPG